MGLLMDDVEFDIDLETYGRLVMLSELTGQPVEDVVRDAVVLYLDKWFKNGDE